MPKPLRPSTIAVVKETVPALAAHGSTITREMYSRLFRNEHIRMLFNQANQGESGAQTHALAAAILGYARNIDNPGVLGAVIERITQKHVGYNIMSEHYPFVAEALLEAIAHVLGEAATPEILSAWGEAYWFLAEILKEREQTIRNGILAAEGGWTGWREFRVMEKLRESSVITSFLLRPDDGGKVVLHKPGQYLTFMLSPDGGDTIKRNYSISSAPSSDTYRISVKREANGNGGSRYLHDQVTVGSVLKVSPPAGDFFLPADQNGPVILLSGGVGLTPMVSMLEAVVNQGPHIDVHYVHGALNGDTHAMRERVQTLARRNPRVAATTFYSAPGVDDVLGKTHDAEGFINTDWLLANTSLLTADVFLCGPRPFLRTLVDALVKVGVQSDRIHYEYFGPADELLAA
ncbi:NO-inducible flavohemoprotein [Acidiphilium acidophilum]|uniref:NO-inducible flavohemoprotein n=1 Tax=Acidiphilium acidophilum TaxID=76588 RepID=UPI002E8E7329|nr:NO-inducible flavohemoprotein [Acidiphilium acidophilum]